MHDQRLASDEQVSPLRDMTARDPSIVVPPDVHGTEHAGTRKIVLGLTGLLGAAWALVFAVRFTSFSF